MSEAPKKIWIIRDRYVADPEQTCEKTTTYIRADIVDELVEALKFAWPIIEHERYKWEGSYGKNFDSAKADRARQACEKVRAALAKMEESHD